MAFLQAFTDDSLAQVGDRRLFMAGFLHNKDAWAAFSKDWQAELNAWPAIEFFKAKDANRLRGEFDASMGWDEAKRNAKVANLAEIISHYQPLSYQFSLNRKIFEEELKPVSPYGFGRPHFQLCYAVVAGIAQYSAREGITYPIEFVFDEQEGVDDDIDMFFRQLIKTLPVEAQNLIDGSPIFRSDRDPHSIPLQAADMLAWHLRKEHEDAGRLPLTRKLLNRNGHLVQEIPDEVVRRWADHHSELPGTPFLRSKRQWRTAKGEIRRLLAAGIDPSKIDRPGVYYPETAPKLLHIWGRLKRFFG